MELKTSRLLLREFTLADVSPLYAYTRDEAVLRYDPDAPGTEDGFGDIVRWIMREQEREPRENYYFVAERLSDGVALGSTYISVREMKTRAAEVGYMYGAAHWGQGYATEAARTVVAFGFNALGMHRIYCEMVCDNVGSVRVAEKCGMKREGQLRHAQRFHQRWWDTCIYAILEDDWTG